MENEIDFETAMNSLESEVKKLESGNMSLEDSLSSFETALGLVKICNEKLESAERRVRILLENADKSVVDESFDGLKDET